MQTNNIKSFAKKARLILMEGVAQRLKYWGFDDNGNCSFTLESTPGGYIIRGQVYNDPSVPSKWNKLKKRLISKQAVEDVIEQAAYTWFNRLMAIKILESNGYISPQLAYSPGTRTPIMVQEAKRGNHGLRRPHFISLLNEYIRDSKEEQALGLLITRLCNNNETLHDVFGRIDDYTEILLPQNLMQKDGLMDLINSELISVEDYKQVELIGWLYQFYISDKKDKVFADFKKNKKARAEDIPAATQIFTPKWIVSYMVENTVGKLYLDYEPASTLKQQMKYLVENEGDKDVRPIISDIKELTLLDPASGSGHILVTGFDLLFKMYREEGYTSRQATENVLKHNLWGLDIDDRAMQLARFAVLLKAAEYDKEILGRGIIPHIYSFPEQEDFASEDIHLFLGADGYEHTQELVTALDLLKQGKNIGSALILDLSQRARDYIQAQFGHWEKQEVNASLDIEKTGVWNQLKPYIEVLLVLTGRYAAVVANPPYMGQKGMNEDLKRYINSNYPITKSDLFAVFMEVCFNLNEKRGLMGMINQHSWMFLSSFEKLREEVIAKYGIISMLHLGPRTFDELSGEVVQSTAFVIQKGKNTDKGTYYRLVDYRNNTEKETNFLNGNDIYPNIPQSNFSKIPGSPIAYWVSDSIVLHFNHCKSFLFFGKGVKGLDTGNDQKFLKQWWEPSIQNIRGFRSNDIIHKWVPYHKGGNFRKWYGNKDYVINWGNDGNEISSFSGASVRNRKTYFKNALEWSRISSGSFGARFMIDSIYGGGSQAAFLDDSDFSYYFLGLLNSKFVNILLQILNPTMVFQAGDINRIPVIIDKKNIVDILVNNNIKLSNKDWDSRETSWDYQQSPLLNDNQSLKQAYTKWFEDVTNDVFTLHANEEELNRIFIDIYGLQDELTPDVPLKDITILQDELDPKGLEQLEPIFRQYGKQAIELPIKIEEVMAQFISYCVGLMTGRYRLDKPGLNIAHPNPTDQELSSYTINEQVIHIDEDAIIPIMGKECSFADDVLQQVKHILHAVWSENTLTENINFMQGCLGMNIHEWITHKFWPYHTRMYKKKPIYWMFCSNQNQPHKSAFRVLTYMHRMDRFTVQRIQRNYLHPHQEYIKREIEKLKENEGNLGRQDVKRLDMLQSWESECRDYNEVLKELANQQIEFDLDDGVTVNYAKFDGAVAKI